MSDLVRISLRPDASHSAEADPEAGAEARVLQLHGGERISGTVEVTVQKDLDLEAFQIGFVWHTEGKGNRVTGVGGIETLAGGSHWRAGDRVSFPFSIVAPWGPLTYSGRILKVAWHLEAKVCRSMVRTDISESLPVQLLADPEGRDFDLGPKPQKKSELEAVKRGLGGIWLTLGIVLLLGSVVFGALRGWDFQGAERLPLLIALAGGFLLSLKGIWGRLGKGKLGEPVVQLSTLDVRRGEEVRFSLVLRPEQRTELRSLEAVLECEERVVHGHGQYQSRHRRIVFERRLSLAKDLVVEPHKGLRKKGSVTLPEDAPTSFAASCNQVVWWLRFEADIVGWPDWNEPFLLTVQPDEDSLASPVRPRKNFLAATLRRLISSSRRAPGLPHPPGMVKSWA